MAALALAFVASASWFVPAPAPRCAVQCCDTIPDSLSEQIPPEKLSEAWLRDDKAKELGETLKGCSLYLVGFGARKTAVARLLSRRLPRYRLYDVGTIMCSTYAAMGGDGGAVSLKDLMAKEPLADVEQLSQAVLREVQQFARSVFVAWDGAITTADYMVMQQGIVVHLDFDAFEEDEVALPAEDAEATREAWAAGHAKADVTVKLEKGLAADDAAYQVVDALLSFIEANPAKSKEWKEKADEALEGQ